MVRLNRAFLFFPGEREAFQALGGETSALVRVACPVHGCGGEAPAPVGADPEPVLRHQCPACGCRLVLEWLAVGRGGWRDARVMRLELPTYDGESVAVTQDDLSAVRPAGRLDLFAAGVLERAWLTLPAPRRAVFDL